MIGSTGPNQTGMITETARNSSVGGEEIATGSVVHAVRDATNDAVRREMVALLPRLRRFAAALTGNLTEADDLVQDTVERALRNLDRWEPGTRLDSWMYRIAQNHWIDTVRAKRRRPIVSGDPPEAAISIDGARVAEARLTFADTCRALGELPEDQRATVALVLIEGLSYRETADILGVPIGTVTSRLARARETLSARVFGEAR